MALTVANEVNSNYVALVQTYNQVNLQLQRPNGAMGDIDAQIDQLERVTSAYEESARKAEAEKKAIEESIMSDTSGRRIKLAAVGLKYIGELAALGVAITESVENNNNNCKQATAVLIAVIALCVFEFLGVVCGRVYKGNKKEAEILSKPKAKEAEECRQMITFFRALSALKKAEKSSVDQKLGVCVTELKNLPQVIASNPVPKDELASAMFQVLPNDHPVKQTISKLNADAENIEKERNERHGHHHRHGQLKHRGHHQNGLRAPAPTEDPTYVGKEKQPMANKGSLILLEADGGVPNLSAESAAAESFGLESIHFIPGPAKVKLTAAEKKFNKHWFKLQRQVDLTLDNIFLEHAQLHRLEGKKPLQERIGTLAAILTGETPKADKDAPKPHGDDNV